MCYTLNWENHATIDKASSLRKHRTQTILYTADKTYFDDKIKAKIPKIMNKNLKLLNCCVWQVSYKETEKLC